MQRERLGSRLGFILLSAGCAIGVGNVWKLSLIHIYGDGADAASEQLIRIALRMRRQYLPGMTITFVEIGNGKEPNVARHLSARQDIMYLE